MCSLHKAKHYQVADFYDITSQSWKIRQFIIHSLGLFRDSIQQYCMASSETRGRKRDIAYLKYKRFAKHVM